MKKKEPKDGRISVQTVEIPRITIPRGRFVIRRNNKNRRALPREISRLVERFLYDFYTIDLASQGKMHGTVSLYDISAMVGAKLNLWLTELSGTEKYIPPKDIAYILGRMTIEECRFQIEADGYDDVYVRLRERGEKLMKPDMSLKAPGGKARFSA